MELLWIISQNDYHNYNLWKNKKKKSILHENLHGKSLDRDKTPLAWNINDNCSCFGYFTLPEPVLVINVTKSETGRTREFDKTRLLSNIDREKNKKMYSLEGFRDFVWD